MTPEKVLTPYTIYDLERLYGPFITDTENQTEYFECYDDAVAAGNKASWTAKGKPKYHLPHNFLYHIWTVVEGDECKYIVQGVHKVNRVHLYYVTTKPHNNECEMIFLWEDTTSLNNTQRR